jgi:hypothetical protein
MFRSVMFEDYETIGIAKTNSRQAQQLEQFIGTWEVIKERVKEDKATMIHNMIVETQQMFETMQTERGFANMKRILFEVVEICNLDEEFVEKTMEIVQKW